MTDEQMAESVVDALGRKFEFQCYCGRAHYDRHKFNLSHCECGRRWGFSEPPGKRWSYWFLVNKDGRKRHGLRGRKQRDAYDVD
jgi:hypothetical protein